MSRFALKEEKVEIRGQQITVRELTHAQGVEVFKARDSDASRFAALLVSLSVIEPAMTEDEAKAEPREVVSELFDVALRVSGFVAAKNA